ncbi:hypothetical protein [Planosporangium mesophilum]|nr:hypothetical protein [Planosporangium mesophilum]
MTNHPVRCDATAAVGGDPAGRDTAPQAAEERLAAGLPGVQWTVT